MFEGRVRVYVFFSPLFRFEYPYNYIDEIGLLKRKRKKKVKYISSRSIKVGGQNYINKVLKLLKV